MNTKTTKRKSRSSDNGVAVVKRRNVGEDNPPETSDDSETSNPLMTGILILNDDCFRKIFMHLNASELLNVITANTRFKFACEDVFKRKYCRSTVRLSNLIVSYPSFNTNISTRQMKYAIKILENFGHLISKLCIRFKFGRIETLLDAVAANCDENLLALELRHEGVRPRKPWSASAIASTKRMKSFLNDLNTQFPKLCHLKLSYSIVSAVCPYADAVIGSHPSLTSFACNEKLAGYLFTEEKLEQFVRLNQQLERLACTVDQFELYDTDEPWDISSNFIRCLDESLPMLKCLEINRVSTRYLRTPDTFPIRFKNLKRLTFHSFLEWDADADVGFMSFLSDSVEVLKLSIFHVNIHRFLKDLTQFKNLKVLHLEYPMQMISVSLDANATERTVWGQYGIEQLVFNNPNLTEIKISHHPGDDGTDTMDSIYQHITEYNADDGSLWMVSYELFEGYSFRKELQ